MKFIKIILAVLTISAVTFSQVADVTSSHNLSMSGPAAQASDDQDRVCVFCHTPHNGGTNVLWNRTNPVAGDFTNNSKGGTLTESSLKCLSCHDGATAVNSLVDGTTADFTTAIGTGTVIGTGAVLVGGGDFGTDLTNDHPIGMDYPADGTAGFNNDETFDGTPGHAQLVGTKVACASCHDPHDLQYGAFLIGSNSGSALCLDCHDK